MMLSAKPQAGRGWAACSPAKAGERINHSSGRIHELSSADSFITVSSPNKGSHRAMVLCSSHLLLMFPAVFHFCGWGNPECKVAWATEREREMFSLQADPYGQLVERQNQQDPWHDFSHRFVESLTSRVCDFQVWHDPSAAEWGRGRTTFNYHTKAIFRTD